MSGLAERFRAQADRCRRAGSPLTAVLLEGAADELGVEGPVAALLDPLCDDPSGSAPALRFAAALHRLVLERRAPLLALHYPSVGGTAPVEQAWPAAREAVAAHLERLRVDVRRPVQTNEVGRTSALLGALHLLTARYGLPVRLLEVGASAGLGLHPDRYAHEVADGVVLGDPASPVRLPGAWEGRLPPQAAVPQLLERLGGDPAPLDPSDQDARTTLTSCVWADQRARHERLRGALAVAARHPVPVLRAGALDLLRAHLHPREGVLTVVWHSVVLQYVDPAERGALEELLAAVPATASAPVARVALEPPDSGSGPFPVHVTTWPGGTRVHVADADPHGPPVRWTGARP